MEENEIREKNEKKVKHKRTHEKRIVLHWRRSFRYL